MEKDKIQNLAVFYYSRKDIQEAIFKFCKNRETVPRYYDGFGKRPDSFGYPSDIMQQVQNGATSFHCSEELWSNPLEISTELDREKFNNLRIGWDLLIDIDCKWFDYTKKVALSVIQALRENGIKHIGIKFSGGKGWHIIVPAAAFPEEINNIKTKDMFPEWARQVVSYIYAYAEKIFKKSLPPDFSTQFKGVDIQKGIKCRNCNEIGEEYFIADFKCTKCKRKETRKMTKTSKMAEYKCPECPGIMVNIDKKSFYKCNQCNSDSQQHPSNFSATEEEDLFQIMGLDMVLVSPRHLFRAPYSLHEKSGFVSVVLSENEIENFQPRDADPLKIKIRDFSPIPEPNEAKQLLISALEWHGEKERNKEQVKEEQKEKAKLNPTEAKKKFGEIQLIKETINYPPVISKILEGMVDGKKRALFALLNFFRSLNFTKEEIEVKIDEWNKKNKKHLQESYIRGQIDWTFRQKKLLPPNYDKPFYRDIGIIPEEEEIRMKNPVSYAIKKSKWVKTDKDKTIQKKKENKPGQVETKERKY